MRSWRTGSSSALSVAAIRSFRWRAMKSRSKRILDEEPWRSAFIRERALPSDVRGPVLLAALRLLAAICFSDGTRVHSSSDERASSAIFCARIARSPWIFSISRKKSIRSFSAEAINLSICDKPSSERANISDSTASMV
jgi:hypothetical protein